MHRVARRMLMTRRGGYQPAATQDMMNSTQPMGGYDDPLAWGRGIVPIEAAKAAIAANESGGRYGEIGPMLTRGSYAGDRAYGKYQVMGRDLPDRLRRAGLPSMSPQEFLSNRDAQEKEFESEFGGLMTRYGSFNDAASMWFSGHPMRANDTSNDTYMSTPAYIAKANRAGMAYDPNAPQPSGGGIPSQTAANSTTGANPATLQALQALTGQQAQQGQNQASMAMGLLNKNPAQEYPYQPLTFPQVNLRHPADPDSTRTALQMINPQFQS